MTTREKFKMEIISRIYGVPYEEALIMEQENVETPYFKNYWITLSRIMQAFTTFKDDEHVDISMVDELYAMVLRRDWKLLRESGETASTEDQSDEVIEKLYNLIKTK